MKNKNSILESEMTNINNNNNKIKKEITEIIKQIINQNIRKYQKKKNIEYKRTNFNFSIPEKERINKTNNNNINNNNNITIINNNSKSKEKNRKFFKTDKSSKHYKVMTSETKKKILEDLKYLSNTEVSKKYGTSIRNIVRWKSNGYNRKIGSGRKTLDPDLNNKLLKWYFSQDPNLITTKIFRNKAKELSNNKDFKASMGWLTLMKKKYNLKFRNY